MQTALPACPDTPSWLLAVLLFFLSLSLSPFPCELLFHLLPHPAAAFLLFFFSVAPSKPSKLLSCFSLHLSIIPSNTMCECVCFFFFCLSIHHPLTHECSSCLSSAKAVNKWTTASLDPVPDTHTHTHTHTTPVWDLAKLSICVFSACLIYCFIHFLSDLWFATNFPFKANGGLASVTRPCVPQSVSRSPVKPLCYAKERKITSLSLLPCSSPPGSTRWGTQSE